MQVSVNEFSQVGNLLSRSDPIESQLVATQSTGISAEIGLRRLLYGLEALMSPSQYRQDDGSTLSEGYIIGTFVRISRRWGIAGAVLACD